MLLYLHGTLDVHPRSDSTEWAEIVLIVYFVVTINNRKCKNMKSVQNWTPIQVLYFINILHL